MEVYNLIIIFDEHAQNILFCRRLTDPYLGKFNFVGGKREHESSIDGAYRELLEETGITKNDACLHHILDMTFHRSPAPLVLEIFTGVLHGPVFLVPEKHPLCWLPEQYDFSTDTFAAHGQVGYLVKIARKFLGL